MTPEIECTECGWQGAALDRLCHPDDYDKPTEESRYSQCPDCRALNCFEDYEVEDFDFEVENLEILDEDLENLDKGDFEDFEVEEEE